jgi:ubiquinone/menaquinone biosynthesis C-methylase UbiE
MFDGLTGRATAKLMARMNRETEREAVELLAPSPDHRVVVLGSGPGVGVDLLAAALPEGGVVGVDPSAAMLADARRRNQRWIAAGRVELVRGTAAALDAPDGAFDGAIAVNSIQLWEPLDRSLCEVGRVLRRGAPLLALTHDWAIERSSGLPVDAWSERISVMCGPSGFTGPRVWRARSEGGKSVAFLAHRA